jgi:hypothetical protein
MSAQGATLGRGTVHIPIWPVAVVVLAATAAVIGLSTIDTTATVREQGAVAPVAFGISHVGPKAVVPVGISHVGPKAVTAVPVGYAGLENPGAYLPRSAYPNGLENPTAYAPTVGAPAVTAPAAAGITVNGEICHQCR